MQFINRILSIAVFFLLVINISAQSASESKAPSGTKNGGAEMLAPQAGATVSAPIITRLTGAMLTLPISTTTISGQGVISYQFDLVYDQNVIQYNSCSVVGTMSSNGLATCNLTGPGPGGAGKLTVVFFQSTPLIDSTPGAGGTLINLNFTVTGVQGSSTALSFQNFFYNECNFVGCSPASMTVNGSVTVGATTAANASITGIVTTSTGRGVASARVMLLDSTGNVRYAITNGFGYYRFFDVPVGTTYLASVNSKKYTFATQTVNLGEDFADLNFVAQ